jgi:hypothetical protein
MKASRLRWCWLDGLLVAPSKRDNNIQQIGSRGWSSSLEVGRGANNFSPKKISLLRTFKRGFGHGQIPWMNDLSERKWVGHVARMGGGGRGMHVGYWWKSQKERDQCEDQEVGGWTIL